MRVSKLIAVFLATIFSNMPAFAADIDVGISAFQSGQYSEAFKILVPLANAGNSEAQRIVGEMAYNGQGVARDAVASFKWNEVAAESGNKIAQYNLGYLYEKGDGIGASITKAIGWYTKSATQGYVAAQHKLGDLYVASDRNKAIYWYDRARQSGDDVARTKFSTLSSGRAADMREERKLQEAEDDKKLRQEQEEQAAYRATEQAREVRERESTREYNAAIGAQIRQRGAENAAILRNIDRQTTAAINESNRVRVAKATERDRASAEQNEREGKRRGDAERERTARADAERAARAKAAQAAPESPKYQPQVVTLPKADMVCPPGSTWHNAAGTGAKGGTCYGNSLAQVQAAGSNSSSNSNRPLSASGTTTRPQTSGSSVSNTRSDPPSPTTPVRQPPRTEWGPIKLEALAMCRQSTKTGKWICNGALDNQIIVDEPTLESALGRQHCAGGTLAAGGPVLEGVQWDAYRCGHALGHGDYDITKRHAMTTARRSYICPTDQLGDGRCATPYDGQDKR